MDAKVVWHQDLTFTGSADSGFTVPLGADVAVGGADDGFRPVELLAISLAGCTAMDVISILRKKQQEITAFEVGVHAERASDHPKVFTAAVITYRVTGNNVDEAAVQRSIALSIEKYCPVYAMLHRVFPIECRYEIYQAGETPRLIKQGRYPD
jgi:putative redox protein